jgi:ubiquinone/menaquinone biosynthesis C-methylase UbiE
MGHDMSCPYTALCLYVCEGEVAMLRFILWFVGLLTVWLLLIRLARKTFAHFPAPAFIGRFLDSDWRRNMQRPRDIIAHSGIGAGMRVLEVGCGSGAWLPFVARAMGERGLLVALDIQPAMLRQVQRKLAKATTDGWGEVVPLSASAHTLPFADGTFDAVYLVSVLAEIPHPPRVLAEIKRVLKPGGAVAVSEFLPDPDYPLHTTVERWGREAGLALDAVEGNFWAYTVRFRKV